MTDPQSGWLPGPALCRGWFLGPDHAAVGCVVLGFPGLMLAQLWAELGAGVGGWL